MAREDPSVVGQVALVAETTRGARRQLALLVAKALGLEERGLGLSPAPAQS